MENLHTKLIHVLDLIFETTLENPFKAYKWLIDQLYQMCIQLTNEHLFIFMMILAYDILKVYIPWFESFIAFTTFVVILYKAFSENEDKENKDEKN